MKIKGGMQVNPSDLLKIRELHNSVLGTENYERYTMEMSLKRETESGGWSRWNFLGWYCPTSDTEYKFKVIKNQVYIISQKIMDSLGNIHVERYCVTKRIMEEMGWWI